MFRSCPNNQTLLNSFIGPNCSCPLVFVIPFWVQETIDLFLLINGIFYCYKNLVGQVEIVNTYQCVRNCIVVPNFCWSSKKLQNLVTCLFFNFVTGKSISEARNICRTCCVPKLFWMSKQNKNNNLCTQYVLQVL